MSAFKARFLKAVIGHICYWAFNRRKVNYILILDENEDKFNINVYGTISWLKTALKITYTAIHNATPHENSPYVSEILNQK